MDRFDLNRFVVAQAPVYADALAELRRGRKQGHWMWFIFPQLHGLGRSAMAQLYAIASLDEARAYFDHPLLGPRLVECVQALLAHRGTSSETILGSTDALKLRSSMTLFEHAAGKRNPVFGACLEAFFDGKPDRATLDLLAGEVPPPAGSRK